MLKGPLQVMSNNEALLAAELGSVDNCAHPQKVYDKLKASFPQLRGESAHTDTRRSTPSTKYRSN